MVMRWAQRRRRFAAFFRFAPRLALPFGRFLAAFFALGRFAAFFFLRAGAFRLGASSGSSIIGAGLGIGGGDGGYIGSIMPEPVQLLSEKSFGSSIGSPLLVVRGRGL
ncbi:MAG: hypothetical protein AUH06_05570 [Gemmatimonadetes bacterium 13_2_20CM_69_27]|nr:MAG: hypothetical protein AUH06_05570 [Gemmatimonadetes bacterium 13_2_20CM_69_27]OLB54870.1 MAG: hypothetical protein AUI13_10985 [Gemmatimonadetes bacterium 13_2_20CM_2_69_23]PYO31343.1 MAG: hypothetical protein DMD32_09330 [Gemmatimonadota bacterium]PYP26473.1 MAG: hypothetical protein DMD51_05380 [Gemmatimonadota bacterium]